MNTFLRHALPWTLVAMEADITVTLATADNLSAKDKAALEEWRLQCHVRAAELAGHTWVMAEVVKAVSAEAHRRAMQPAVLRMLKKMAGEAA